jgi:hypothetical protein
MEADVSETGLVVLGDADRCQQAPLGPTSR